jgi:hypothetical protein
VDYSDEHPSRDKLKLLFIFAIGGKIPKQAFFPLKRRFSAEVPRRRTGIQRKNRLAGNTMTSGFS